MFTLILLSYYYYCLCIITLIIISLVYQHLVSLLVQPPLQSELPGLQLTGSGRAPDLDAAIQILEQVPVVSS